MRAAQPILTPQPHPSALAPSRACHTASHWTAAVGKLRPARRGWAYGRSDSHLPESAGSTILTSTSSGRPAPSPLQAFAQVGLLASPSDFSAGVSDQESSAFPGSLPCLPTCPAWRKPSLASHGFPSQALSPLPVFLPSQPPSFWSGARSVSPQSSLSLLCPRHHPA